MIGTSNTGGNNHAGIATAAEIAQGIGAIVQEMRTDFPNAGVLLLAVFPRGVAGDSVRDKVAERNWIIQKPDYQRHVFYTHIGSKFLDDKAYFLPGVFKSDNLHPDVKGYEIRGEVINDKLVELMK